MTISTIRIDTIKDCVTHQEPVMRYPVQAAKLPIEFPHSSKARIMNEVTRKRVNELFGEQDSAQRFIPYASMFKFEALLFSDADILA